jgi:hypothetical protein
MGNKTFTINMINDKSKNKKVEILFDYSLWTTYKVREDSLDDYNELINKYNLDFRFFIRLKEYLENKNNFSCNLCFEELRKYPKFEKFTKKYFMVSISYNWEEDELLTTF